MVKIAPDLPRDHLIVMNLCGRGDKDIFTVADAMGVTPVSDRIERRFAELAQAGRGGLVTFLCAGDPDPETSAAILAGLPAAGADVIEIGMPFSDPMADGPAIQAGSLRALKAGMTLARTLDLVRRCAAATTPRRSC